MTDVASDIVPGGLGVRLVVLGLIASIFIQRRKKHAKFNSEQNTEKEKVQT